MIRKWLSATSISALITLVVILAWPSAPASLAAADTRDEGRFVWHDLMTKDVAAAKKFYGDLFGWRFEDTHRGDRSYVLARFNGDPVAGLVDISSLDNAGPQWLSFMAVTDVDKTIALVRKEGGKVLVEPREIGSIARAAVIADPQGAPLGFAQLRRTVFEPAQPTLRHFFWQEYLARDATKALEFYKRLIGFNSEMTDTQLGVEYHVLKKTKPHAGLFQLSARAEGVEPNWLPYVLVDDPAAFAARATGLGGHILVPAMPEHRKGTLVVIADPGGAPLALQKYPF